MKDHASIINEFSPGSSPEQSASHIPSRHSTSRMAAELQTLIRLFDDVLLEGYSNNHDTLSLPTNIECNPTCNYCGASLFLSYFNCAGTCLDLETDSPRVYMSIRVCGPCYVEGRFCSCKEMTPMRLRDFSSMLRERNGAATTLANYLASHPVMVNDLGEISERWAISTLRLFFTKSRDRSFSWPQIAIFQAAQELWKRGRDSDAERVRTANYQLIKHTFDRTSER